MVKADFSFLSVGDWGASAISEEFKVKQNAVALQMERWAEKNDAKFVLNTGDNFYWCGIQNSSDFQVEVDFVDVYNSKDALRVPWFSSLGNHEYGYNVTAELMLREERDDMENWILPSRYYSRRIPLAKGQFMSLIVLDTSPCVSDYRSTDQNEWDPCSEYYPTCSPGASDDDFEGECLFHDNIMSQNCTEQFVWFNEELSKVDTNDWLFIMGHHPADELDVEDFYGSMTGHGKDVYINGHVHALQQYEMDGDVRYFTTGAGSLTESSDQESELMLAKKSGDKARVKAAHVTVRKRTNAFLQALGRRPLTSSPDYDTVFSVDNEVGFTAHTFSDDFQTLTTTFFNAAGEALNVYSQKKGYFQ